MVGTTVTLPDGQVSTGWPGTATLLVELPEAGGGRQWQQGQEPGHAGLVQPSCLPQPVAGARLAPGTALAQEVPCHQECRATEVPTSSAHSRVPERRPSWSWADVLSRLLRDAQLPSFLADSGEGALADRIFTKADTAPHVKPGGAPPHLRAGPFSSPTASPGLGSSLCLPPTVPSHVSSVMPLVPLLKVSRWLL